MSALNACSTPSALVAAGLILAGCDGGTTGSGAGGGERLSAEEIAAARAYVHPGAQAYYAANPEFFRYASPADLPGDLVWEDGRDQPEIGSPDAVKGGTVVQWEQDFPRTLRFIGPDANGSFRSFIHDDNTLCVVKKHPQTGRYYPALANAWAISKDRKTAYFRLAPEARYSDGVAVTADDYFFLMYFMRQEWHREPWSINWYTKKYTHITKFDDHTIAVGLADAKPDTMRFFEEDIRPIPRHFYREYGEDYVERYQWRIEPTTGAYTVHDKDIVKGRSITQTRVADWWARDRKFFRYRFNADKVKFIVIRDVNKAIEAFKRGDFDMLRVRTADVWNDKLPDDLPEVARGLIHKATFYNDVPRPTYALRINRSQPLLDNRDIRVGINHATNWQAVIDEYFRGEYKRMRTTGDGYGVFTHPSLQPREFSVAKAGEAFAKAGFDRRGPDGILVNDRGERLSFTLSTGYRRLEDAMTILEREARKAGLEFKLEILDSTAGWKKAQEKKHEITMNALNVSVEMYPRYFDDYHSFNAWEDDGSPKPHTNNMTMTADPEVDAMIDRYEASSDAEEIQLLSHRLQEWLHEDAAYCPGFVVPFYRAAYWRYIRWPDGFNERLSREHDELNVHWVDEAMRAETRAAHRSGGSFEKSIVIFDQYAK